MFLVGPNTTDDVRARQQSAKFGLAFVHVHGKCRPSGIVPPPGRVIVMSPAPTSVSVVATIVVSPLNCALVIRAAAVLGDEHRVRAQPRLDALDRTAAGRDVQRRAVPEGRHQVSGLPP